MPSEALPRCEFEDKDLQVKMDLQLPGDVNAISPVVGKVMGIVTEMGCAVGHEFEIKLALCARRCPTPSSMAYGTTPPSRSSAWWPAIRGAEC